MNQKSLLKIFIICIILVIFSVDSMFIVNPKEQVLVTEFGEPKRDIQVSGLYFKIPFIQKTIVYDRRILDLTIPAESIITNDKKRLIVDTFMLYRIKNPLLFYQSLTNEMSGRSRLESLLRSALRRVLGKVKFEDLLSSQRGGILDQVFNDLEEQADKLGIKVIDVRIRRADLPPENSDAIFQRMRSERFRIAKEVRAEGEEKAQKIRAAADRETTVILAEANKGADILRGEGEAIAIENFAKVAKKDEKFYEYYRMLQAYRSALGDPNTSFVLNPKTSGFLKFLR